MNEEREVRAEGGTRELMAARRAHRDERRHERAEQEGETDGAELSECLEVEAVCVEHRKPEPAVSEPEPLEASGSPAEPRVVLDFAPRDVPVLGPAVAGEAEEPPALIRLHERRRRGERVIGTANGGLGAAGSNEARDDDRDRDHCRDAEEGTSRRRAEADPSTRTVEPHRDERSNGD